MRRTSVSVVAATGFTIKEKQFMVTSWKKWAKCSLKMFNKRHLGKLTPAPTVTDWCTDR